MQAVVGILIVVMTAFVGASALDASAQGFSTTIQNVDSNSEWTSGTVGADLEVVDGFLQLNDTGTSGTYTSSNQDYNATKLSYLKVYGEQNNTENTTVTANVSVYDSSDNLVDDVSKDIQPNEAVDISSLSNLSDGDYYKVQIDLSRDSTSDATPRIDNYSVVAQENTDIHFLAIVMLVLVGLAVAARIGFDY